MVEWQGPFVEVSLCLAEHFAFACFPTWNLLYFVNRMCEAGLVGCSTLVPPQVIVFLSSSDEYR